MAIGPKWVSVRDALDGFTEGKSGHAIIEALEAAGWVFSPPKPVLPVVSAAAQSAFEAAYDAADPSALSGNWGPDVRRYRASGLRAAFKVMLGENLERVHRGNEDPFRFDRTAYAIYLTLTGEEWPK